MDLPSASDAHVSFPMVRWKENQRMAHKKYDPKNLMAKRESRYLRCNEDVASSQWEFKDRKGNMILFWNAYLRIKTQKSQKCLRIPQRLDS